MASAYPALTTKFHVRNTSATSHYRGYFENGRRDASLKGEGNVYLPSDDRQFEVFEDTHMIYPVLDSRLRSILFQSPISDKSKHVLDVGSGDASWAIDTAEKFPNRKLPTLKVDLNAKSCQ